MTINTLATLMIVTTILGTQQETIASSSKWALDKGRSAIVHLELRNLQTMFIVEISSGNPNKAKRDFAAFIRENFTTTERDPAVDLWGNGYFLIEGEQDYSVGSAGPDGEIDTDDDLYFTFSK